MSTGPDQSLADAFIRVGYDLSEMPKQERDILRRAKNLTAKADAMMKSGSGAGRSSGSGSSSSRSQRDSTREFQEQTRAIERGSALVASTVYRTGAPIPGELRGLRSATVRALDGVVDKLVDVSKSMKAVAEAAKEQMHAANDFRRMSRQGSARASLNRRVNTLFGTSLNTDPYMRMGHVAAESRMYSGMGFGGPSMGEQLGSGALSEASRQLISASGQLVDAAQALKQMRDRARRSNAMKGMINPNMRGSLGLELMAAQGDGKAQAAMYAMQSGLVASHFTDPEKSVLVKGGKYANAPFMRRAPGTAGSYSVDTASIPIGRGGVSSAVGSHLLPDLPMALKGMKTAALDLAANVKRFGAYAKRKPGEAFQRVRAGAGLTGAASLAGFAPAQAITGAVGAGVGKLAMGVAALAPKMAVLLPMLKAAGLTLMTYAPAGAAASAAILGIGNTINLLKAPFRQAGNWIREFEHKIIGFKHDPLIRAFSKIGKSILSGLSSPIRFAARGLGIFDARVGITTNILRTLGRVARSMRFSIAFPFKTALGPIFMLNNSLKSMMSMLTVMAPYMAARGLGKMVMMYDDLNAAAGRVKMAFHDAGQGIFNLSDRLAQTIGMVKQDTLDLAANIGLMFTGVGIGDTIAAKMAEDLTMRAADMAAAFGQPIDEIKRTMMSALTGQHLPLQKYDVLLRQADVNQRAVAMGLAETTDKVNFQARALATHNMIMERSVKFAGAMKSNMNTLGSLVTEIKGRFANFATEIGEKLYPAARQFSLLIVDLMSGANASGLLGILESVGQRLADSIRFVRLLAANWADAKALGMAYLDVLKNNIGAIALWAGQSLLGVFQAAFEIMIDAAKAAFNGVKAVVLAVWDQIGASMVDKMKNAAIESAKWWGRSLRDPIGFIRNVGQGLYDRMAGNTPETTGDPVADAINAAGENLKEVFKGIKGLNIPKLELEFTSEQRQVIDDLIAKIEANTLRGDNDGERFVASLKPEGMTDGEGAEKDKDKTQTGQIVTAEQLRDMQNDLGRKQIDVLQEIANNTRGLAQIGGGGVASNAIGSALNTAMDAYKMLKGSTVSSLSAPGAFQGRDLPYQRVLDAERDAMATERSGRSDKDDKIAKNTSETVKGIRRLNDSIERMGGFVGVAGI